MEREIKFRVWDKINKSFARRSAFVSDSGGFYVDSDPHGVDMSGQRRISMRPNQYEFAGQWTGLKDKNGKEIYEGDICITGFYNHEMPTTYMNQEVSFEKGTFTVKSGAVEFEESRRNVPIQWVDEIEVIGNIFENKDLL